MTSKIAQAIFKHVNGIPSFTTRDIPSYFPAIPFGLLKEAVKELVDEGMVFKFGEKRGTFYSTNANFTEAEVDTEEISPKLIEEVEKFIANRQEFVSSDLFAHLPNHPDHILRKVLVYLRDEKGIVFLHGHGKSSIWSKFKELPEEEEQDEQPSELKELILKFAKANPRWFKRSELDDIIDASAYEIRNALYDLMSDGEIQMRGERRSTEYAYAEVVDEEEIADEGGEHKADPELKKIVFAHFEEVGVLTIPLLIEKFSVPRIKMVEVLRELEVEEQIYHEGIKKTSRYIHKDVTEDKVIKIIKEQKNEKEEGKIFDKPIDRLSTLFLVNSTVYITYVNSSKKYELRAIGKNYSGGKTLFAHENPEEVIAELFSLTKGVDVELAV